MVKPLPMNMRPGGRVPSGKAAVTPAAKGKKITSSPLSAEKRQALEAQTKAEQERAAQLIGQKAIQRRRLLRELSDKGVNPSKQALAAYRVWRGKEAPDQIHGVIKTLRDGAQKKFGSRAIALAHEMDNMAVGIPCPFVWEYLLQQNVLPLGVLMTIVGPPASAKTATLAELQRWFQEVAGLGVAIKNESKISPDLSPSILGYEDSSVIEHKTQSLEGWQEGTTYWVEKIQNLCNGTKEKPGPGPTLPVCFGVDSIAAKLALASQKDITDDGFASRAHALEALLTTRYMKYIPQQLEDWPFLLVLINQLKKSNAAGMEKRELACGWQIQFQECFQIENVVLRKKIEWIDSVVGQMKAKVLQMRCQKNSQGEDSRRIETRMAWWYERNAETGLKRQRTQFQWGWSTIALLKEEKGQVRKDIQDIVDLHIAASGDAENAAWSKRMGVSEKHPISWQEMGTLIQQDPIIIEGLRDVYNIKNRGMLKSADDYLKAKAQEVAKLTL